MFAKYDIFNNLTLKLTFWPWRWTWIIKIIPKLHEIEVLHLFVASLKKILFDLEIKTLPLDFVIFFKTLKDIGLLSISGRFAS